MKMHTRATTVYMWGVSMAQYGIVDELTYSMRLFFADHNSFNMLYD